MDSRVIEEKLESLRRCVSRVEARRPATVETLLADADLQDILTLNLTRAVQLSVDIASYILSETENRPPATMGEAFEALAENGILDKELALRMRRAVGFRNIAVHNYGAIDWAIVHSIAHERLDDFRQFARVVSGLLEGEN